MAGLWKNKSGTAERNCKCGSWKQHWLNYSKMSWPRTCSVSDCSNYPTLGAHIYQIGETKEYIVPMCDKCNSRSDAFGLDYGIALVSANQKETCDK